MLQANPSDYLIEKEFELFCPMARSNLFLVFLRHFSRHFLKSEKIEITNFGIIKLKSSFSTTMNETDEETCTVMNANLSYDIAHNATLLNFKSFPDKGSFV